MNDLRKLAELWWIHCAVFTDGKRIESWLCRACGERADSADELWEKVKPRASKLYIGKTWAQFKRAMGPQSDNWADKPYQEYAWAFSDPS